MASRNYQVPEAPKKHFPEAAGDFLPAEEQNLIIRFTAGWSLRFDHV